VPTGEHFDQMDAVRGIERIERSNAGQSVVGELRQRNASRGTSPVWQLSQNMDAEGNGLYRCGNWARPA